LYGWCLLLVINTGTLAALSVAFAGTLATVVPIDPAVRPWVAVAMIALLAAVNHFGVGWGAVLQNATTFSKLLALAAIVVAVAWSCVAVVAIFWVYEGWCWFPFTAVELCDPGWYMPRGLIWGIAILIASYVAVIAIYLLVVPLGEMRVLGADVEVPRAAVTRI